MWHTGRGEPRQELAIGRVGVDGRAERVQQRLAWRLQGEQRAEARLPRAPHRLNLEMETLAAIVLFAVVFVFFSIAVDAACRAKQRDQSMPVGRKSARC